MESGLSDMELEIKRLTNSVLHLLTSNMDLKEAMAEDADIELKEAFNENLVTIAKYKARIASMEEELRRAKGGQLHEGSVVLPVPQEGEDDTAAKDGGAGAAKEGGAAGAQQDGVWL